MSLLSLIPVVKRAIWTVGLLFSSLLFLAPGGTGTAFSEEAGNRAMVSEKGSFQLENGLLTVNLEKIPLNQILRAISQKRGIKIILNDPANEEISVKFTELPVDKGLEEILKARDYFFLYRAGDRRLRMITVYSRKDGKTIPPGQLQRQTFPTQGQQDKVASQLISQDLRQAALSEVLEEWDDEGSTKGSPEVFAELLEKEERPAAREAILGAMADFEQGEAVLKATILSLTNPLQEGQL